MVEITPYELLSHAVIRLAAKDILEGYKKVYKKYGRSVLDINNWERKKSKFSKRPCFIFNNQYHYEGTLMGNLGSALCFLYSSQFEMFCRLNPDVVVNHIHMLYI